MEPRFEFPVPVDKVAYFLPVFGVFFIAMTISAPVFWVAAVLADKFLPAGILDSVGLLGPVVVGVLACIGWIRRLNRIHRERKLVIDRRGITYVRFADKHRIILWEDVVSVREKEDADGASLVCKLRKGRFVISDGNFRDYSRLKWIIAGMVSDRVTLLDQSELTASGVVQQAALAAQAGHPERSEQMLREALAATGVYTPDGRLLAKAYAELLLQQGRVQEAHRIQEDFAVSRR